MVVDTSSGAVQLVKRLKTYFFQKAGKPGPDLQFFLESWKTELVVAM